MKKVSIIIPVYCTEKYLRQCIDSVLSQTYKDIEIILIDDGSPDSSGSICDEYSAMSDSIIVIHKTNEGLSMARNDGISKATGDYIFFLDSDDYISPSCIESLVTASGNGALAVIGYQLDLESEKRIYTPSQAYGEYKTIGDFYMDFAKFFATKYNFAWGKLYKSEIIKGNNLRFIRGVSLAEDVVFNQHYYKHCNNGVILVNDNGYFYRQHGTATLSKMFNPEMFEWNKLAYDSIRDRLIEEGAYTLKNKNHFLSNVLGNYLYSFKLLALNTTITHGEKKRYLSVNSRYDIFKEAASTVAKARRIDDRIFAWLILNGHHSIYLLLESLKFKIKHIC